MGEHWGEMCGEGGKKEGPVAGAGMWYVGVLVQESGHYHGMGM